MRRIIAALSIAFTPTLLLAQHSHHNFSLHSDADEVVSCNDIRVSYDDRAAARAEEELPVGSLRSLKISSAQHAAIRVTGWDQPRYAVTACKAAATADALREVNVRLSGNEVTAAGPEAGEWMVYFLVQTPRNATFEAATKDGPIAVRNANGMLTLHAQNGPISVKESSGSIDASTMNGPIAFSGGSGTVKLAARNGPISVKLSGSRFDGTLTGETNNGPLALKVPKNFASGVELTVNGRGPIVCHAAACGGAKRMWSPEDGDHPRQLSFGDGPRAVTLSTTNGPVSVKELD